MGPKRKKYDPDAMDHAFEAVLKGDCTVYKAAMIYNVPQQTLRDRFNGRVSHGDKPGRDTVLTTKEELGLVAYLKVMAEAGFGLNKSLLKVSVMNIVNGRAHPFGPKGPGKKFMKGFLKRHPSLSMRKADPLAKSSATQSNPTVISDHFKKLGAKIDELNIKDKPASILNFDEIGFSIDPQRERVIAAKGSKHVHAQVSGNKEHITVLACISAEGRALPPAIVFTGKYVRQGLVDGTLEGSITAATKSGYVTDEIIYEYFTKVIDLRVKERPLLVIFDGHGTHLNEKTITFCLQNDIHLYCLPAHTTHLCQPCDKGCFKVLRDIYYEKAREVMFASEKRFLDRYDFPPIFKDSYLTAMTPSLIRNSFLSTGIYPFDSTRVSTASMALSKLYQYQAGLDATPNEDAAVQHEQLSSDDDDAGLSQTADVPTIEPALPTDKPSILEPLIQANIISEELARKLFVPTIDAKSSQKRKRETLMKGKATIVTSQDFLKKMQEQRLQKERNEKEKEARKIKREEQRLIKGNTQKMKKDKMLETKKDKLKKHVKSSEIEAGVLRKSERKLKKRKLCDFIYTCSISSSSESEDDSDSTKTWNMS